MHSDLNSEFRRLGHRVVVGIALAADGCDGLGFGEALGVADGSILDSAVAVMDQTTQVGSGAAAGPQGHVEGIQGKIGAQRGGDLPAQHDPGEHVQDERDVDPAGVGADVGQVSHPQLVRGLSDELSLDQVLRAGRLGPLGAGGVEGLGAGDAS